MKNRKPKTLTTIENKYSRRVDKLIQRYQDKTMQELWVELDKLKEKMRKELAEIGITE